MSKQTAKNYRSTEKDLQIFENSKIFDIDDARDGEYGVLWRVGSSALFSFTTFLTVTTFVSRS